ncbi:MAG: phosphate/phosphite/phosphonate ABC transporter substrate-binding protein [Desulfuromonadales bacterium]|nr:phosphate/phosphite/phosphonate ABC transporter substrate-binding protein [Desulfuromonadales bacterium]
MIKLCKEVPLLLLAVFLLALPAATAAEAEKPTIYFGVIPRYNPMIMYQSYQPLMDFLTANSPYRFELKLSRDYTEAVRLLKSGQTQVTSLGDVTYIEANQGFGAIPILKPLNENGEPFYTSIIIVREDSPIRKIADLRGKSFAFSSYHSTSGNLIPRYLLFRQGISLFDFGSYTNLDSHDAVAKAVLKGRVDAGAVKDVVAYRHKEQGLRYLAVSAPIPSVPIVVRRDAPPELISAIKQALLSIDPKDPVQRQRMKSWDPEFRNGFVTATEEDYAPILRMMNAIPEGCGIKCH